MLRILMVGWEAKPQSRRVAPVLGVEKPAPGEQQGNLRGLFVLSFYLPHGKLGTFIVRKS